MAGVYVSFQIMLDGVGINYTLRFASLSFVWTSFIMALCSLSSALAILSCRRNEWGLSALRLHRAFPSGVLAPVLRSHGFHC